MVAYALLKKTTHLYWRRLGEAKRGGGSGPTLQWFAGILYLGMGRYHAHPPDPAPSPQAYHVREREEAQRMVMHPVDGGHSHRHWAEVCLVHHCLHQMLPKAKHSHSATALDDRHMQEGTQSGTPTRRQADGRTHRPTDKQTGKQTEKARRQAGRRTDEHQHGLLPAPWGLWGECRIVRCVQVIPGAVPSTFGGRVLRSSDRCFDGHPNNRTL